MAAGPQPPDSILLACYIRAKGKLVRFVNVLRAFSYESASLAQTKAWFDAALALSRDATNDPDDAA